MAKALILVLVKKMVVLPSDSKVMVSKIACCFYSLVYNDMAYGQMLDCLVPCRGSMAIVLGFVFLRCLNNRAGLA